MQLADRLRNDVSNCLPTGSRRILFRAMQFELGLLGFLPAAIRNRSDTIQCYLKRGCDWGLFRYYVEIGVMD